MWMVIYWVSLVVVLGVMVYVKAAHQLVDYDDIPLHHLFDWLAIAVLALCPVLNTIIACVVLTGAYKGLIR